MDGPLEMLEAWDAGHAVATLRLTSGGPAEEQSAHLLAFELLRDCAGLALPASKAEWGTWGADALRRVEALPGIVLPPSTITTVKSYVFNLLKAGWEPLASAAPSMNHITVSRTLPSLEAPVSPRTVAAAKEQDRLAAWLLAEVPEELRAGAGGALDPSATGVAIRLLLEWKHARKQAAGYTPQSGASGEANALAPGLAELLQDLEDRLSDRTEEVIATAVAPLAARLSLLEGGERKPARARPSAPATVPESGPIVLTEPGARGPAVVEGKRPTGKSSFPETERPAAGRQR